MNLTNSIISCRPKVSLVQYQKNIIIFIVCPFAIIGLVLKDVS